MRLAIATLALAACGKQPAASGDCADALKDLATLLAPTPPDVAAAERDAAIERCKADHWSSEATACLKTARSTDDLKTCQTKLTKAQQAALAKAMAQTMGSDVRDCQTAVNAMNRLLEKMCACADAACADAIDKERASVDTTAASRDDQCGVLRKIAEDYASCRAKATSH